MNIAETASGIVPFGVDHNRSAKLLINDGNYNFIEPVLELNVEGLAIPFRSKTRPASLMVVEARYFQFLSDVKKVTQYMKDCEPFDPWRIANAKEILTFGALFPEEQLTRRIIGCGILPNDERSLILAGGSEERRFLLYDMRITPREDVESCYLGVRNVRRR